MHSQDLQGTVAELLAERECMRCHTWRLAVFVVREERQRSQECACAY